MNDKFNSYADYKKSLQTSSGKGTTQKKSSNKNKSKGTKRAPYSSAKNSASSAARTQPKKKTKKVDRAENKKARKLERQQRKEQQLRERKERVVALASDAKKLIKSLGIVLCILLLIGELMLMLNLNSQLDKIQFEINDYNAQLSEKKQLVKELNSQKEAAYKSETIENLARYKLGMVYPKKEQSIYINLD